MGTTALSASERLAETLHQMAEVSWDPIGMVAPLWDAQVA